MPLTAAPLRVLVVDDDDDIRDVLCLMAQREGSVTFQARDGLEAVDRLQSEKFDLMLLDLTMPRMGGEDVLRWLQQHPHVAGDLQVVVVSALATERRSALDQFDLYAVLDKPVRAAHFRMIIGGLSGPQDAGIVRDHAATEVAHEAS